MCVQMMHLGLSLFQTSLRNRAPSCCAGVKGSFGVSALGATKYLGVRAYRSSSSPASAESVCLEETSRRGVENVRESKDFEVDGDLDGVDGGLIGVLVLRCRSLGAALGGMAGLRLRQRSSVTV